MCVSKASCTVAKSPSVAALINVASSYVNINGDG